MMITLRATVCTGRLPVVASAALALLRKRAVPSLATASESLRVVIGSSECAPKTQARAVSNNNNNNNNKQKLASELYLGATPTSSENGPRPELATPFAQRFKAQRFQAPGGV